MRKHQQSDSEQANGATPSRTYTTRRGVVLTLRPIPLTLIRQIKNDKWGMPQPPVETVRIGPKKTPVKQTNPDDPAYKLAFAKWEEDCNFRFLAYVFTRGIETEPDPADVERLQEFTPGASPALLKNAWIMEQLADDDEMGTLAELIMGQTMPTQEGVNEAEAEFRSDGERDTDQELSVAEIGGDDQV